VKVYAGRGADDTGNLFQVFVDARVRYMYGGEATYFTDDAVIYDGISVRFDPSKELTSKTDFLTAQLGITARF